MTGDGIINAVEGMGYTDSGMSSAYVCPDHDRRGSGRVPGLPGQVQTLGSGHQAAANHFSQAPIRGFGGQECKSVPVPMVCSAIRAANMDPLEVFKKNFVRDGDRYIWRDNLW